MQHESLDEVGVGAYQAVELRAIGQGGKGIAQFGVGVAIKVPLAVETAPTGEDGQGNDLAAERDASGPGLLFGGREWQNSSTIT
jgi:hypothetical protein